MNISQSTRQAYTEVDNFIELLDAEDKNKIPKKLREFFKLEKDKEYIKHIDARKPIGEQSLKEETLALIAMLNLRYICEDEKEKTRLKKIYQENENKYQVELREKYNSDNIFKNKKESQQVKTIQEEQQLQMIGCKESILKKLIRKIKDLFNKKI